MLDTHCLHEWDDLFLEYVTDEMREQFFAKASLVQSSIKNTDNFWMVSDGPQPIFLMGVSNHSLIEQSAYIWFVPFQVFSARYVRATKRLFERWAAAYVKLYAQVRTGDRRAEHFARFFGFSPGPVLGPFTIYVRES